ncbi:MAG: hypothetical protein M3Y31_01300, partial [Gemmatimonadota bacterium]|nr:hypothetical protein [Gemmatimonadota bacterium]
PSMACDYRFKAGRGLAAFGQSGRAQALLREGLAIAEAHSLNEWYFRLERAIGEVAAATPAPAGPARVQADPQGESALARLASGLQEYATATAGRY